jgi:uncharacterized membrane protein YphA (DoxX/SURF4 family)
LLEKEEVHNLNTKKYTFLIWALASVYIVFGLLKVFDRSPIKDLIVAAFPFMQNQVLLILFGLSEVFLGLGLVIRKTRKAAALLIVLHVVSTFLTIIFAFNKLVSQSGLTLEGEFVFKNIILLAVAVFIFQIEQESQKSK